MAIEITYRVRTPIGLVVRWLNNLCPAITSAPIMRVYVGQVDKDPRRGHLGLARALHPPIRAALPHHDPLTVERHLRMHPARGRMSQLLFEPESASEPVECHRHVAVKEIRDNLSLVPGF